MSLYERLGLNRGADPQEVRRAYLKLSKTAHPDKGGSEEEFKKIQQAYEVLSDDQKRSIYDQTGQIPGEEGAGGPSMGGGGMPFGFPFDLGGMFGGMFGGMGGGGGGGMRGARGFKRPKGPPKIHEIGLTLHDFYYGKQVNLNFERSKFCKSCKGEGAEDYESCGACGGSGVRESHVMIGPGMMATSRGPCSVCTGEGKKAKTVCKECNGLKFKTQQKTLNISIEPGMRPGDVLKFYKECSDQHEYEEPGDVHIVLREADESSTFTRMGDDLLVSVHVSLKESLLGKKVFLTGHPAHPNGFSVDIPAGVLHGDTVTVKGEGMPVKGAQPGSLQIAVTVRITDSERDVLREKANQIRAIFE